MFSITADAISQLEIKRSKFISYIYKVNNQQQFLRYLKLVKSQHPKASHICYGVVIGGSYEAFDDDGEPNYTAGKPILDCLKKQQFYNTAIIVVRYFGGIKLGAGGLVRAYTKCAASVIASTKKQIMIISKTYKVIFDYSLQNSINEIIYRYDIKQIQSNFGEKVELVLAIETDKSADFIKELNILNIFYEVLNDDKLVELNS